MAKKLKVIELFAGVGGFRIGLEGYSKKKNTFFKVVWANQWEPSKKKQIAADVYRKKWPNFFLAKNFQKKDYPNAHIYD